MKIKWQKIAIGLALIGALIVVTVLKQVRYNSDVTAIETQLQQNQTSDQKLPVLLELGSHSCNPCKMMMPILRDISETYKGKLNVEFIDIMQDQQAARKYDVRLIPLQIFFDEDGNELFRHEGFFAKEDILAKWEELGVELQDQE